MQEQDYKELYEDLAIRLGNIKRVVRNADRRHISEEAKELLTFYCLGRKR
jgi:histone H3/H4